MNRTSRSKHTLDKDLGRLANIEEATGFVLRGLTAPGLALVFLLLAAAAASIYALGEPRALVVIVAAGLAAYMAMNIGANDVANNVGAAVGARAITMVSALVLAAIFEVMGALIAGDTVVATISSEIIRPEVFVDPSVLIRLMLAALVSSALWINFSTWVGAPISTTHAIVGGVVGAAAAAAGLDAINWLSMATIATSWIVTPALGAGVAIIFQAFIKTAIIYQDDKIAAARRWVPVLTALMVGSFATYLVTRLGLHLGLPTTTLIGVATFIAAWAISNRSVLLQSQGMPNRNRSLRALFRLPLIGSAALLSFAHGANDVANAVGPLAAIVHAAKIGQVTNIVDIPFWVMLIGALGISCGLLLYGPKLVRIVGSEITKLNPMRAYSVALAVSIIVIAASWFGLPVSSTHIAVGAVFGVGVFREWYIAHSAHRRAYLQRKLERKRTKRGLTEDDLADEDDSDEDPRKLPSAEELNRRKLVRRAHLTTIVTAWATTVPASGLLGALVYAVLGAFS
ncbi:inorganic phosphate transporter [Pseudaminobacter soli (ex Li et al. 2025)]|uniref:Phosphate transporter n=1 Tax=Pseudaminobacter soli (ex Li et al. 2025) TaxID=1295366 RepID=A0A2P7SNI1_9HYPH|nr:inorganic phosphate transporter [Mesorhizobium soli]PSJ64018.1 anion permease [Mesorhizobium soli]